jgi:two-component system response regulator PilR (NtrC family)
LSKRILIVDDEPGMRRMLEVMLRRAGFEVTALDGGAAAVEHIARADPYDLVITDLVMPAVGGLEVLSQAKRRDPATEVVVITAYATTEAAVEAMRRGAYDYVQKPFSVDEMGVTVERALEKADLRRENVDLRARVSGRWRLGDLLGRSRPMLRVIETIRQVAKAPSSVLISGESGTGKELVAGAIHTLTCEARGADAPFVAINCAAIPPALMEAELFGHEKGAFTGATHAREGIFRAAHGGTLFLDEISEIPRTLQATLLRVLQEKKVRPVGSSGEEDVDVRIIAASNRDLDAAVARGEFREDLFYRLNVIRILLPPLRERREDVPLLAAAFAARFARAQGKEAPMLSPAAVAKLVALPFPGNVRELENLMERAVTLAPGAQIGEDAIRPDPPRVAPGAASALPESGIDLERELADAERKLLLAALDRAGGVQTKAAKLLGITFRSMRYRLAKHGLEVGDTDDAERQPD